LLPSILLQHGLILLKLCEELLGTFAGRATAAIGSGGGGGSGDEARAVSTHTHVCFYLAQA